MFWRFVDCPGGMLPKGRHIFPVQIVLPDTCPPSFESDSGYIHYWTEGDIDIGEQQHRITKAFMVVKLVQA